MSAHQRSHDAMDSMAAGFTLVILAHGGEADLSGTAVHTAFLCAVVDLQVQAGVPRETAMARACETAERAVCYVREVMREHGAARAQPGGPHPSHRTRFSDASSFDEICVLCGATDTAGGGWGHLAVPCPALDEERREHDERKAREKPS